MVLTFSLGSIAMEHLTKLHNYTYIYSIVQVTVNSDITGTVTQYIKSTGAEVHTQYCMAGHFGRKIFW